MPAADTPSSKPRGIRRWIFLRLTAVLIGLSPFVLLEAGLRLFDVGPTGYATDPLAGFNRNLPLFEKHGSLYRTAAAREPFFPAQEFAVAKPSNAFRIFCFGGSTVHGHPYQSETAFPKWLELELAGSASRHEYEAINCGGVSYASYRMVPLVEEVMSYQPDLIVVACGENEFLEDRTYYPLKSRSPVLKAFEDRAFSLRLVMLARSWVQKAKSRGGPSQTDAQSSRAAEVKTRLDESSGYASYHRDEGWQDRVAAQFEESLRTMTDICRKAKVPIMLINLGSNLRDCPPYKSEHRAQLSPEDERLWQSCFDAATPLEATNPADALAGFHKAEAIDPQYALLSFRIAHVLDGLGEREKALKYYERARDDDICPLRTTSRHEQILERVSSQTKTPLVNAATILAAQSDDHIPGNDWYLDHVHPNIHGHQLIARELVSRICLMNVGIHSAGWSLDHRRAAYTAQLDKLGPGYFSDGLRRVEWLERWARRERVAEETLPAKAVALIRAGVRHFELGQEEAAWNEFASAVKQDKNLAVKVRGYADQLSAEGRAGAASRLLKRLSDTMAEAR